MVYLGEERRRGRFKSRAWLRNLADISAMRGPRQGIRPDFMIRISRCDKANRLNLVRSPRTFGQARFDHDARLAAASSPCSPVENAPKDFGEERRYQASTFPNS